MKYEEIYEYIGEFGTYQACIYTALFLMSMWCCEAITAVFAIGDMPHWCHVQPLSNYSFECQKYISIPYTEDETYSSCQVYSYNYSSLSDHDIRTWNRTLANMTDVVDCNAWTYEQSTFTSTLVSRLNLVCDQDYMAQLLSTIYMFGVLVGAVSSGALSDRIGRKKTMFISLVVKHVGMLMSILSSDYAVSAVGRFILGTGSAGCFLTCYVLAMELIGPRHGTAIGCGIQVAFSVGFVLQPIIASAITDDVFYQIAAFAPNLIFFVYFIILPESPRWLIVNSKHKEADTVFRQICKVNRSQLPDNFDVADINKGVEGEKKVERKRCTALLQSPRLRSYTIMMDFCWFTCSLVYYALSLNTGTLSGDLYINTFISGAVEIPANILAIFLMNWAVLGRRLTNAGSLLVAALASFLCIPMIIYDYGTVATALSMVGKTSITITFAVVYVFSSELFPTEVRNIGLGTASMCARVGGMIAPYMGVPLENIWEPLPSLVFGILATVAGVMCLIIPETLNKPTFNTIQEIEDYYNMKEKEGKSARSEKIAGQVNDIFNKAVDVSEEISEKKFNVSDNMDLTSNTANKNENYETNCKSCKNESENTQYERTSM